MPKSIASPMLNVLLLFSWLDQRRNWHSLLLLTQAAAKNLSVINWGGGEIAETTAGSNRPVSKAALQRY